MIERLKDERAALIWALHFFALYARDIDNFASAPRGAWMWSELFSWDRVKEDKGAPDLEPAIDERLDDDLALLGVNREHTGGCYTWGLPVKLFRRADELLTQIGDVGQFSNAQQSVFRNWLWNGGPLPTLRSSEPSPTAEGRRVNPENTTLSEVS